MPVALPNHACEMTLEGSPMRTKIRAFTMAFGALVLFCGGNVGGSAREVNTSAAARCNTSQPNCEGLATFGPVNEASAGAQQTNPTRPSPFYVFYHNDPEGRRFALFP